MIVNKQNTKPGDKTIQSTISNQPTNSMKVVVFN